MNGGDLTRSTFKAHKHYSGVRMQQGRVQLDADWNEQLDLTAHRDRAEAWDVIGAAGFPKVGGGFGLTVSPDGHDLLIGPGRAWVGGHLCEADGEATDVADAPDTTTVKVTSLVLDGTEIAPDEWVEVSSASASVVARATAVDAAANTVSLDRSIGSLSGDLTLRRRLSYAYQPDLPEPAGTTQSSATDPRVVTLANGSYLAYLDVWERAITALDDPGISEPALGVDTTTRSKVVWQLRLLDLAGLPEPVDCETNLDAALDTLAPPTGVMAARAVPPAGSADLCRPTPAGGYVGLENHLYRVHVHDLDATGRPVVLWSRENASVVTAWLDTIAADILEVADIGKDEVLGFQAGDWVELSDDEHVLEGRPGTLVRLLGARDNRLTLDPTTPTGSTDIKDFPRNPQVRRWDSEGPVTVADDSWVDLENGVQVSFPTGGGYRRHDYWLVPARSLLADLDWPRDSGGEALAVPPAGVRHDVARVALVTRTDAGLGVTDCRHRFPSLTELTAADVAVDNDVCSLPGVETVQEALDALCRANDLRRHNRLLHGYGIVCGLAVRCGGDEDDVERPTRAVAPITTTDRRDLFRVRTIEDLGTPVFRDRFDLDRIGLDELRTRVVRRHVTVDPGSAIDADGNDLELSEPVVVDVLGEVKALGDGVLDKEGDGEVCLVLRNDPDRGPVVAVTRYSAADDPSILDGTLINDIYNDCIAKPFKWVKAQLGSARAGGEGYLLRTSLTNLLTYVANPKSGGNVFVADNEHEALLKFYEGLKRQLRSHTFCAMFDDARPYPDYPATLAGIRTISGAGMHARARMHPGGREVWTTGGGANPLKATTMLNRYSLDEERLVASIDPLSGRRLEPGQKGSETAAAATDIAFSPDGRLIFVAVPTRDGNDTIFRVGELGDRDVKWRPATTICGVRLVSLATTEADPDHVYAVGVRRTSTGRKAFSLKEFTGAGLFRIPTREVPDGLGPLPATASLNTTGNLAISPQGEAVFTCGEPGATADRYDRLAVVSVPGGVSDVRQVMLDGSGADDLTLVLGTGRVKDTSAWTVVGSGSRRQVVGVDVASGERFARIDLAGIGRISLQAVRDRILVTDSNSSLAQVLDCSREEFREQLRIPVQVAPMSVTMSGLKAGQVVVLNLVSNSLTAIDAGIVLGDELDLAPLVAYRRNAVEAFADLVGGLAQYLKDCICDHLLVKCPPKLENTDLDLAAVSIRGGSVFKVCNFSRRRYVKSFPTVGYWLSMVPVLPWLRKQIATACCTLLPDYVSLYSTSGHDDADDRVDAARVLSFLEVVQAEDPVTRLRNLDLGIFSSFLKGANSGEWGEDIKPVVDEPGPIVDQPDVKPTRPGGVVLDDDRIKDVTEEPVVFPDKPVIAGGGIRDDLTVKDGPRTSEILIGNILRNPVIARDLSRTVETRTTSTRSGGVSGFAAEPGQLDELLSRVASLEAEIAALKAKPSRSRTSTKREESPDK